MDRTSAIERLNVYLKQTITELEEALYVLEEEGELFDVALYMDRANRELDSAYRTLSNCEDY